MWSKPQDSFFDDEKFWIRALILDLDLIKTNNWSADNFKKARHLNKLSSSARDTVMWQWSDSLLWQRSIDHNMDVLYQVFCLKTQIV